MFSRRKSKGLDRLQCLQHKAIKLISFARFDSPAPLINTLNWLPIREQIHFKICMYVFKCIHGHAPKYLTDFISHRLRPVTGPITRSSNDSHTYCCTRWTKLYRDKSFYVTAPPLWMPSVETSGRQNHCVQKDAEVSHLIQNTDLLCVFIVFVFHACTFI